MEIKKIQKKDKLYKVDFTDGTSVEWHENVIVKHQLIKPKTIITSEKFECYCKEHEVYLAVSKALKYLGVRRSKKQIKLYLLKFYAPDIVEKALSHLEEYLLIDEEAYALEFCDYCYRNNRGPLYVKNELKEQDIPYEVIIETLNQYTKQMEYEACERAFLKQMNLYRKENHRNFINKMRVYLNKRGFNDVIIITTLENNQNLLDNILDEEKAFDKDFDRYFFKYSKSYQGKELEARLIRLLYQKGFSIDKIKKEIERRERNDS